MATEFLFGVKKILKMKKWRWLYNSDMLKNTKSMNFTVDGLYFNNAIIKK